MRQAINQEKQSLCISNITCFERGRQICIVNREPHAWEQAKICAYSSFHNPFLFSCHDTNLHNTNKQHMMSGAIRMISSPIITTASLCLCQSQQTNRDLFMIGRS